MEWIMPLGRFDRERWKRSWQALFETHDLVHNNRETLRVAVSDQGDGAFAVVDVDTLWRNRTTDQFFHWKGRACKVYTKVGERWLFLFQTGLLEYERT
jgi:hypothetical protein